MAELDDSASSREVMVKISTQSDFYRGALKVGG